MTWPRCANLVAHIAAPIGIACSMQYVNERMNEIEVRLENAVTTMVDMEEEAVNAVKEACENAAKALLDSYDKQKFVKKKKGIPITAPIRMIPGLS